MPSQNLTNIDTQAKSFFKIKKIGQFLPNLIQVALIIGSLATLIYLIWGAIEYITSGGNQESNKSAKQKISQSIFGLAVLASVWVIWRLIIYFIGLSSSVSGSFTLQLPKL